ncbi:MAG: signal peptidase I [Patescibacteria group bacterium]|nr:signal peptidase I [Patescibacteria group bacterium]
MSVRESAVWLLQALAALTLLGLSVVMVAIVWTIHHQHIQILGVQTGSMRPALAVGDGLVIRPSTFASLAVGDIVGYRASSQMIVSHRIVSLNSATRQLLVQGDSNQAPDVPVQASQVIGRVSLVLPGFGSTTRLVRSPLGLVGLVYLPVTVVIVCQIETMKSYYRRPYRVAGLQS